VTGVFMMIIEILMIKIYLLLTINQFHQLLIQLKIVRQSNFNVQNNSVLGCFAFDSFTIDNNISQYEEYDLDEQDFQWLIAYNQFRIEKRKNLNSVF
jgi:hypothetical protein